MRNRITVRGNGVELRGYIDGDHDRCAKLLDDLNTFGVENDALIIFSKADDDYNPFVDKPDPQRDVPGLTKTFEQMESWKE